MKRVIFHKGEALTAAQIAEIDAAAKRPIVYDEDSPDLTPETFAAFQEAAARRDARKNKWTGAGIAAGRTAAP